MNKVVITGITGQDGASISITAGKGFTDYSAYRRSSSDNFWFIEKLEVAQHPNLHLVELT